MNTRKIDLVKVSGDCRTTIDDLSCCVLNSLTASLLVDETVYFYDSGKGDRLARIERDKKGRLLLYFY